MERSTSVPMGMGEQSLTPGEQRILALMEQGQQRLEQRLDSMDQRLRSLETGQQRTDQRLEALALEVDEEATASKVRDLKLAMELEGFRQAGRKLIPWVQEVANRVQRETHEAVHLELDSLRVYLSLRLDLHDIQLEVKQTLERHDERLREHGQAIEGLQQEVRKLTAAVEHLVQAPRVAASP
jgi:hypothetical protein